MKRRGKTDCVCGHKRTSHMGDKDDCLVLDCECKEYKLGIRTGVLD